LRRRSLPLSRVFSCGLLLTFVLLMACGCAVRRTTHVPVAQVPPPAQEASLAQLVERVNAQSRAIHTLSLSVDFSPAAGSVYSGVIKEYPNLRGFILVAKPEMIRTIVQAPVVRTNIIDMASNGQDFEVYLPTKRKFITGKTAFRRPAKNALESLRPQHILDALLVPSMDAAQEKYFLKQEQDGAHRYYVIDVVQPESQGEGGLTLKRELWFDRSTLELVRLQLYGPKGAYEEDVHYSNYRDFQGVHYPAGIEINRPIEDYRLAIAIHKATLNQPIGPEKFVLKKPDGVQLLQMSAAPRSAPEANRAEEGPHGK
jgi:outer membrane lipoprotein-sorting protein